MTDLYINKNKGWQFAWTPEEDDIIRKYYPKLGTSGVHKYLPHRNQNGIKSRAAKIGVKYLTYNQNFFDEIDSHEKAYWFGFLYADGYVTSGNRWGLELSILDINHMQNLLNAIDANMKIKIRERNSVKSCLFQIKNTHMVNTLIDKGVIRNKTENLKFPSELILSKEYYSDFIRGFFDGDGSVCFYYNKQKRKDGHIAKYPRCSISIVCKSENFIKTMMDVLENAGIPVHYYINKRDNLPLIHISNPKYLRKFFEYIYYGSCETNRLNRKYERMFEIVSLIRGDRID